MPLFENKEKRRLGDASVSPKELNRQFRDALLPLGKQAQGSCSP